MLDSISWGEFLKGLVAVLIIYYGFILVRYYRSSFKWMLEWSKTGRGSSCLEGFSSGSDSHLGEQLERWIEKVDLEILPSCRSAEELLVKLRSSVGQYDIPRSPVLRRLLARHILLASQSLPFTLAESDILDLLQLR